ncbi:uncharacterized protein C9orf153 homolog isoform X2 [Cavia porcellus]|uniref:uncharacterized protein C9orf153 homolog isoform X2 n=1 Tax=Cavia porcellus TaxID=10141 RepID=UPI002FE345F9
MWFLLLHILKPSVHRGRPPFYHRPAGGGHSVLISQRSSPLRSGLKLSAPAAKSSPPRSPPEALSTSLPALPARAPSGPARRRERRRPRARAAAAKRGCLSHAAAAACVAGSRTGMPPLPTPASNAWLAPPHAPTGPSPRPALLWTPRVRGPFSLPPMPPEPAAVRPACPSGSRRRPLPSPRLASRCKDCLFPAFSCCYHGAVTSELAVGIKEKRTFWLVSRGITVSSSSKDECPEVPKFLPDNESTQLLKCKKHLQRCGIEPRA